MATQGDFDFIISWNRCILNIVGVWPEPETKNSLFSKCKFVLAAFLMFYSVSAPQMADLFIIRSNMDLVAENLSTSNIAITTALLKLLVFWFNREDLGPLILYMRKDWMKTKKTEHLAEMREVGRMSRSMTVHLVVLTETMVFVYTLLQIYMNMIGAYPSRRLFYRSYYPYDTSCTPVFEITWISQCFGSAIAAVAYVGVDSFIGVLILHVCGQFAILKYELKHLLDPVDDKKHGPLQHSIKKKLKFIIRGHEYLNKFAETVEDIFNLMFLVQLIALSIMLCLQGFQIINSISSGKGTGVFQTFFMFLFIMSAILLFYLYCYIGEQLDIKTTELGIAAFDCEWFTLPASEIKSLGFILLRTKTPLVLTAGKFCPFTMVTFCEVLKRSVGYLSVLLTIRESLSVDN